MTRVLVTFITGWLTLVVTLLVGAAYFFIVWLIEKYLLRRKFDKIIKAQDWNTFIP